MLPGLFGRRREGRRDVQKKKPAAAGAGRARKGEGSMLLANSVSPLTALGFEALDGESRLLHGARDEAPHRVLLPGHRRHNLGNRRAVLALQHRDHLRHLAALARALRFGGLGGFRGLGRGLFGGGLLRRGSLGGRNVGRLLRNGRSGAGSGLSAIAAGFNRDARFLDLIGNRSRFSYRRGFVCLAAAGAVSPRLSRAFQMRLTAVWRSLNFLTGLTPGKLFQISTRREAGQSAASLCKPGFVAETVRVRYGFSFLNRRVNE